MVLSAQPDGPAAMAGVMLGDVLVALDGTPVHESDDVQRLVSARHVGATLAATILRAGAPVDIRITVGERPPRTR
jgi:S1-C subfamily serine protease